MDIFTYHYSLFLLCLGTVIILASLIGMFVTYQKLKAEKKLLEAKCDQCLYYQKGECFREPPTVLVVQEQNPSFPDCFRTEHLQERPYVKGCNACGEYKEK